MYVQILTKRPLLMELCRFSAQLPYVPTIPYPRDGYYPGLQLSWPAGNIWYANDCTTCVRWSNPNLALALLVRFVSNSCSTETTIDAIAINSWVMQQLLTWTWNCNDVIYFGLNQLPVWRSGVPKYTGLACHRPASPVRIVVSRTKDMHISIHKPQAVPLVWLLIKLIPIHWTAVTHQLANCKCFNSFEGPAEYWIMRESSYTHV
jgi:hypothetical protein